MPLLPVLLLAACAAHRPPSSRDPMDAALGSQQDAEHFSNPKLAKSLDERSDSQAREGNAVELLLDKASFERRFQSLADADVVLIKTFIFTADETGEAVAAQLAERARAGALVVVQYDIKGSMEGPGTRIDLAPNGKPFLVEKPLMETLRAAGAIVVPTNVPQQGRQTRRWADARGVAREPDAGWFAKLVALRGFTTFDHEKYWITGRKDAEGRLVMEAILGGQNIASEYAWGGTDRVDAITGRTGWHDLDVAIRGPVVQDIVRRYLDVMSLYVPKRPENLRPEELELPQPAAGQALVRFIWNQPALGNRRNIERAYRTLTRATPDDGIVRAGSAYFTPGRYLHATLSHHLKAGGKLAVLTNSAQSTDMPVVNGATRDAYERLLDESPRAALYEWPPEPNRGTYHVKLASFGNQGPVIAGSANLDGLSAARNSESVVIIEGDPAFRAAVDAVFDADFARSQRVTNEELARESWLVHVYRRSIYRFAWSWLSTPTRFMVPGLR